MPQLKLMRSIVLPTLVFILCCAAAVHAAEPKKFHWNNNEEAGTADLLYVDEPVLQYVYAFKEQDGKPTAETSKVFHHVFGPGSGTLLTNGPGPGLYPHHRGMFVGWRRTIFDGGEIDSWHCPPGKGEHLRHSKFIEMEGDDRHGTMTAEINWVDREGKPVIVETRTVDVHPVASKAEPGHSWQIDWTSTLKSVRGEIRLDGDRQHSGFQFRAAQPVAVEKSARYIRPEGFPETPTAVEVNDNSQPDGHINLGWLAMTFPLEGKQYTVEYFEDPSLPKPSRYSERPYGRFGAFFKATLDEAHPLTMRYRVNVSAGEPASRSEIQQRYEAFAKDLPAGK